MQHAMDSDHGLPIPVQRLFIDFNPNYDLPLPFRKHLKQVTELAAENSTLCQVRKAWSVSKFENLPLEIPQVMYSLFSNLRLTKLSHPSYHFTFPFQDASWLRDFHEASTETVDGDRLLCVSHQIRIENLDLILHNCLNPLSDWKIYFNNWHKNDVQNPITLPKLECMTRMLDLPFHETCASRSVNL